MHNSSHNHNFYHLSHPSHSPVKPFLFFLFALFFLGSTSAVSAGGADTQSPFGSINPLDVRIARDYWGVPHIFGKTDADVGYGLAWANAEDAFAIMQETILTGKGMMGLWKGREGAVRDYLLQALDIPTIVHARYESDLSEAFRRYLDGYTQGLNAYAAQHPRDVLVPGSFPVTPQELLQGSVFITTYMVFAMREIEKIVDGDYNLGEDGPAGSNAYALSASRTADGKTYLAINPHQPMEGPFSFYECHVNSEEGWNFHGGMYHNGLLPGFGNNDHLGWAMTYNALDLVDTYRLEMHPERRNHYRYDEEWRALDRKRIWLSIKWGPFVLKVPKWVYWSSYGPTFRNGDAYYGVRFGNTFNIQAADQLYRMNKAGDLEEWLDAMRMLGIPRFHFVYADREDNIFFVDNGQIPDRRGDFDWTGAVPGLGSENCWQDFLPFDSLPQVLNPRSGYVFNTNNSSFHCTDLADAPDSTDRVRYPDHAGYKRDNNNRAWRFAELISARDRFDFDQFKAIKFDNQFPACSPFLNSCEMLFALDSLQYPHLAEPIGLLSNWDRQADPQSSAATLFALTIDKVFQKHDLGYDNFSTGFLVSPQALIQGLEEAQQHLLQYFKKLQVPLSEFQRIIRGDMNLPLPGYFDVLAANYSRPADNGRYKVFVGDAYTQFVVFGPQGVERLESLQPFGASANPESPHYTDQMELFARKETKVMHMDPQTILERAVQVYHPGADRPQDQTGDPLLLRQQRDPVFR
jgi:acyl-homoserine-lactone acylase